ncbi:winged helix-turn-helix domain-containing protein [Halolamina sp. C58]|uniref:winged helix-turn-helix domain-containing protein n=1 Tax=Halolamina sp. C58 TaxID=3421640 RepID=UPI003EBE1506
MRASADWMSIWDDRILEYIAEHDGGSVGDIADHELIRVSQPHISRRCGVLKDHGLLRALGNGVYMITEDGQKYLHGELDAEDLSKGEENGDEAAV